MCPSKFSAVKLFVIILFMSHNKILLWFIVKSCFTQACTRSMKTNQPWLVLKAMMQLLIDILAAIEQNIIYSLNLQV